jgi:hypothetical protein
MRRAVVPMVITAGMALTVLSALPAAAQGFEVSGSANCKDGTYVITWEVENLFLDLSGQFVSAELGGAASGSLTFSPDPLPPGGTSVATSALAGSTAGTVTLTVTLTYPDLQLAVEETASVELDGDCTATTTTTIPSTSTTPATSTPATAPRAAAVGMSPRFTG